MSFARLNVSTEANRPVAIKRMAFDSHVTHCPSCRPELCADAESMWRDICITALRTQDGATPGDNRDDEGVDGGAL